MRCRDKLTIDNVNCIITNQKTMYFTANNILNLKKTKNTIYEDEDDEGW